MKRILASAVLACALFVGTAHAGGVGIGLIGGVTSPSNKTDGGSGSHWGIIVPVRVVPLITVEPFYSKSTLGDEDVTTTVPVPVTVTIAGAEFSTYGANVALAFGGPISMYPYVGLGRTNYKRQGFEDSAMSYQGGVGLGVSLVPKVRFDVRGEYQRVVTDTRTRNLFHASVGVSMNLLSTPLP